MSNPSQHPAAARKISTPKTPVPNAVVLTVPDEYQGKKVVATNPPAESAQMRSGREKLERTAGIRSSMILSGTVE
jgi:hypothetical protein